VTREQLIC